MPNRILRDGALHSRAMNTISLQAECLFYRILMVADDFGLFEADTFSLKSRCFGSRSEVLIEQLAQWRDEIAAQELILLYEHDGRALGAVNKWKQARWAGKPKFDLPEWGTSHIIGGFQRHPRITPPAQEKPKRARRINGNAHQSLEGFDAFYAAYPRKQKRVDAERAWKALAPDETLRQRIADAIEAQKRSPDWTKDAGKFIPYPASWLNGRRWEDEISAEVRKPFPI